MNAVSFISALITDISPGLAKALPIIRIIMLVVLAILSIILIGIVLIQPSNSEGMGAISGQSTDTYYAKNKGRSIEGVMKRLTIVISSAVALISILFFVTLVIFPIGLAA